jgi:hypothetical protein
MPKKAGSAKYTEHLAVAIEPNMKQDLDAAASAFQVEKSTIVRWALQSWLDARGGQSAPAGRSDLEEVTRG